MTATECPDPGGCPVPDPYHLPNLRSDVLPAGSAWFNATRHGHSSGSQSADVFNRSGLGDARFSPIFTAGPEPIGSTYVARSEVGALLETVMRQAWGSASKLRRGELEGWSLRTLVLREDLRVADLRDDQLLRHGIERLGLVSTSNEHYRCTRQWADRLWSVTVGGQRCAGMVWHSRMVEGAASAAGRVVASLLSGSVEAAEVAVVYDAPSSDTAGLFDVEVLYPDLSTGAGLELVLDLADDLRCTVT